MNNIDKFSLVWNKQKKWIRCGDTLKQINKKPELDFEYDELYVTDSEIYKIKSKKTRLKKIELDSVKKYLSEIDLVHQKEILGVDNKGRFLDKCLPDNCYSIVWDSPNNIYNYIWDFDTLSWKDAIPVNLKGEFISVNSIWNSDYVMCVDIPCPTINYQQWIWNFDKKIWEDVRPIEDQKEYYFKKIDFIYKSILSDKIGYDISMQYKYKQKYDEAIAYKNAGYPKITDQYPYIYNESILLLVDAKTVANSIISKFNIVNSNLHSLEGFRLAANKKVRNATEFSDMADAINLMNQFQESVVVI
jgi:hypothetical protein